MFFIVDHADQVRLELCIPGEQRFYLKAANEKERQQWLVALGSCKASLQTMSDPSSYLSSSGESVSRGQFISLGSYVIQ